MKLFDIYFAEISVDINLISNKKKKKSWRITNVFFFFIFIFLLFFFFFIFVLNGIKHGVVRLMDTENII